MRLHLARLHHPADQVIVDAILGGTGMIGQKIADMLPRDLAERAPVRGPRDDPIARFRLAEVDHQVALGGLIGVHLVVRFLAGVDEQGRVRPVHHETNLGHEVLDQCPGSLGGIVVAKAQPASRLEYSIALGHCLLHHRRPVRRRLAPNLVDDDLLIMPARVEVEPRFPHEFSSPYWTFSA